MQLTDAEQKVCKEHGVNLHPAPRYLRFPSVQAAGWEICVVRAADFLFVVHGTTREEALEEAKRKLRKT